MSDSYLSWFSEHSLDYKWLSGGYKRSPFEDVETKPPRVRIHANRYMPESPEGYMTAKDAAIELCLNPKVARMWVYRKKIPSLKINGNYYVKLEDMRNYRPPDPGWPKRHQ